jgi:hypothetical protein
MPKTRPGERSEGGAHFREALPRPIDRPVSPGHPRGLPEQDPGGVWGRAPKIRPHEVGPHRPRDGRAAHPPRLLGGAADRRRGRPSPNAGGRRGHAWYSRREPCTRDAGASGVRSRRRLSGDRSTTWPTARASSSPSLHQAAWRVSVPGDGNGPVTDVGLAKLAGLVADDKGSLRGDDPDADLRDGARDRKGGSGPMDGGARSERVGHCGSIRFESAAGRRANPA